MRLLSRTRTVAIDTAREFGSVGVEAEDVGYAINGRNLVDGVSLTVRHGEIVAVLGPNGAGKSTLLGLLTGDLTPHHGLVRIADRPIADYSQRELALRRGVLPQAVTLSFPFTVDEVVRMGRAPHAGLAYEESEDEIVARCLAETDVSHLLERAYPSLSGGERARVSLARVLAQGAPVLFLDEPTAALDLKHTEDVLRLARARARKGDAVVIVLHDLNLAAAYADRIALMARGRLVACGAPAEVCTAPLLSELYGHPVDVMKRPGTDELLILPSR
ncbi:heme ABC transporter ATP-binding protein [Streptomyces sp. SID3343]|uniref:heme ABC transporter ATP-binding protein n=1 Tax=Streptomyces sp. SID3343 TaxID=2690260 RepID=UPI00136A742B|nr:heme ABC transporter ATP-binding protein [Streptomyces sp. SID3343]MYW02777.1 heme ABC transporter ATP-binding protein [Streptomyces sp. SID3343]